MMLLLILLLVNHFVVGEIVYTDVFESRLHLPVHFSKESYRDEHLVFLQFSGNVSRFEQYGIGSHLKGLNKMYSWGPPPRRPGNKIILKGMFFCSSSETVMLLKSEEENVNGSSSLSCSFIRLVLNDPYMPIVQEVELDPSTCTIFSWDVTMQCSKFTVYNSETNKLLLYSVVNSKEANNDLKVEKLDEVKTNGEITQLSMTKSSWLYTVNFFNEQYHIGAYDTNNDILDLKRSSDIPKNSVVENLRVLTNENVVLLQTRRANHSTIDLLSSHMESSIRTVDIPEDCDVLVDYIENFAFFFTGQESTRQFHIDKMDGEFHVKETFEDIFTEGFDIMDYFYLFDPETNVLLFYLVQAKGEVTIVTEYHFAKHVPPHVPTDKIRAVEIIVYSVLVVLVLVLVVLVIVSVVMCIYKRRKKNTLDQTLLQESRPILPRRI